MTVTLGMATAAGPGDRKARYKLSMPQNRSEKEQKLLTERISNILMNLIKLGAEYAIDESTVRGIIKEYKDNMQKPSLLP
jgi:hypothetical protein